MRWEHWEEEDDDCENTEKGGWGEQGDGWGNKRLGKNLTCVKGKSRDIKPKV